MGRLVGKKTVSQKREGMTSPRKVRFVVEFGFQRRLEESANVLNKFPDRLPVIIESGRDDETRLLPKRKYLVPRTLTMDHLIYIVRKQLQLSKDESIFIYVRGLLLNPSMILPDVYERYASSDGFLYITYAFESVFG